MIGKIKEWFFYKNFQYNIELKKDRSPGLNSEQNITILFDGTSEEDRKKVHRFKKKLNPDAKKSIKSLAYLDNAFPLDNVDYAAYNKKNINWYGVPFGAKVEEFIQEKSDLLLVLCKEMLPHYEYIIAHSQARFKAGADIKKSEKYFDLIIECVHKEEIERICDAIVKAVDKIAVK